MVTTTRTTPPTTPIERNRIVEERTSSNTQVGLWITLAVIAFAALGYAFYHYSNPTNNPSATAAAPSDQSATTPAPDKSGMSSSNTNANVPNSTATGNGTMMNNDTSTAPNTGTPSSNSNATSQPSTTDTGVSNSPDSTTHSSSTAQ